MLSIEGPVSDLHENKCISIAGLQCITEGEGAPLLHFIVMICSVSDCSAKLQCKTAVLHYNTFKSVFSNKQYHYMVVKGDSTERPRTVH